MSQVADVEGQGSHYRKVASFAATDLSWNNVSFTVGSKVKVLTDCWGHVPAGKVCAIMGPSGARKSSLLNVLAGRSAPAPGINISGSVSVSGQEINPVKFREHIAYVMQDDALMATATPAEALEFSASLRLPPTTTKEEIQQLVDKLLSELGLMECKDTVIGGPLLKGISGGQRKRTSVGIVHRITAFLSATLRSNFAKLKAENESRPEVGSSRKSKEGFVMSSIPTEVSFL